MQVLVEVRETLSKLVTIEAINESVALQIAKQHYREERLVLDSSDFVTVEFEANKKDTGDSSSASISHLNF